jgi:sec-independent protein translocase protein TatA
MGNKFKPAAVSKDQAAWHGILTAGESALDAIQFDCPQGRPRRALMDIFAPSHLLILLVIVLIIFGPSKLGDVGGAMGKAIRDFKKAMNEPDAPSATTPTKTAQVDANPTEPKA